MFRIGNGFDIHPLKKGRKLILGGIQIPFEKGLFGHSDADVLIHSLIDSLLGAAGLPDIGYFFPDTSPQFKDIDSAILLQEAYLKVKAQNYSLQNMDSTILCEKPKLVSYIPNMKKNISQILETDIESINIKSTTAEGLGLIGRSEGIAALSNILLKK